MEIPTIHSVMEIGEYTFAFSNLMEINLPHGVTRIGKKAFYWCNNLEKVYIPNSVKSIKKDAFDNCSKLTIYTPENSYAKKFAEENNIPVVTITIPLEKISLPEEIEIEEGKSNLLKVTYNPEYTTDDKNVKWSSSNEAIVTVDTDGKALAKKRGTATITAKVGTKVAICRVTVIEPTYPLQSINLNKTSITINEDATYKLTVIYNPSNTTDNKTVTWSSSNTKVATVDKTGTVKGVEEGTATITAKVGTKTASCKVTVEYKLPFKDVAKSDWFYEPVKWAYKNKVVTGYNETTFAPNDKTSRGQLVTILWRLEGKPDTSKLKNRFTDVPNTYYTEAIKWANSKGIVTGYGGTTKFGPEDRILRQDLALILMRYAKYKGKDTTKLANISNFADYKKAQNYAETALRWAVQNSIIQGNKKQDGTKTLDPQSNATRAEIVTMLMRYCQK